MIMAGIPVNIDLLGQFVQYYLGLKKYLARTLPEKSKIYLLWLEAYKPQASKLQHSFLIYCQEHLYQLCRFLQPTISQPRWFFLQYIHRKKKESSLLHTLPQQKFNKNHPKLTVFRDCILTAICIQFPGVETHLIAQGFSIPTNYLDICSTRTDFGQQNTDTQ